jgi:predicted ATPase/DNA-binding CsgD family transcriptional regulator
MRSRLVTLTGPGGVGKTRLALQIAETFRRSLHDGVWLAELASVSQPGNVAEAIAGTLRVPEQLGRTPEDALAAFVSNRELLLLVDNCEHVLETCSDLVEGLLRTAPGLHVLATSREILGVTGEVVYAVTPLGLPPDGDDTVASAVDSPALTLLLDRARAADQQLDINQDNLSDLVEICRRLDGLPLALELAAAQLRSFSPSQLTKRLYSRFAILDAGGTGRRRSLRQTVEWSFELCTKTERRLWIRLSVFAADFGLDAIEAVCEDAIEDEDFTAAVFGLVDKSILLVQTLNGRRCFRMLETLRDYALELLRDQYGIAGDVPLQEAELRSRHLAWYAQLAAQCEREWFGPDQPRWVTRLTAELPNIRAALQFSLDHPEHTRSGQLLAADLCHFWLSGTQREGEAWLARLLDADPSPSLERVHALAAMCWVSSTLGLAEQSADAAMAALDLVHEHAPEWTSRVHQHVGMVRAQQGDSSALPLLEQALALAMSHGGEDSAEAAYAWFCVAFARMLTGDADGSARAFAECFAICRSADERWWLGWSLLAEGFFSWMGSDPATIEEAAMGALVSLREIPDVRGCVAALNHLALAGAGGEDTLATYLFGVCDEFWRDAGGSLLDMDPWATALATARRRCQEALGEQAYDREYRRGRASSVDEALAVVLGEGTPASPPRRLDAGAYAKLTRREEDVVRLLAEGLSNREIAGRLVLSPRTVETHVQNILNKTGFVSRVQVATWHSRRDLEK